MMSIMAFSQIEIGTNFELIAPLPIDTRIALSDTIVRNSIYWRYEGLKVFTLSDTTNWQLQGGVADSNWVKVSGAGGSSSFSGTNLYEKELTSAEVAISVGFNITSKSMVFLNGTYVKSTQWSGIGTKKLTLILNIKQYDNFLIKQ